MKALLVQNESFGTKPQESSKNKYKLRPINSSFSFHPIKAKIFYSKSFVNEGPKKKFKSSINSKFTETPCISIEKETEASSVIFVIWPYQTEENSWAAAIVWNDLYVVVAMLIYEFLTFVLSSCTNIYNIETVYVGQKKVISIPRIVSSSLTWTQYVLVKINIL